MTRVAALMRIACLTAAYVAAGVLGLSLARLHPSVSPVWPPTGIAIAGLLVGGMRLWPAIALGAFLVNWWASHQVATSLGIAFGNTCEAVVAVWLVQRFAGGRDAFTRARTFFQFLLYGAIAGAIVSATIGVSCLAWSGSLGWERYREAWLTWWLADAVGALLFTPLVVTWVRRQPAWSPAQRPEAVLLLAVLVGVALVTFGPLFFGERHYPVTFLPMPVLLWAAFRFTPRETTTATLVLATIAVVCTLRGNGPFATLPVADALLMLQLFLGCHGATALTVAIVANESRANAVELIAIGRDLEQRVQERTRELLRANEVLAAEIAERGAAQRVLRESESRFRELVEIAPDALVIFDHDGRIEMVNARTEELFGYERGELVGQTVEMLLPEHARARHETARREAIASPRARGPSEALELFGQRKDGGEFPIDVRLSPIETRAGLAVSATIRDLTRRTRAEQERLANESLRSQVAVLARRTREIGTLNRLADMLRQATSLEEAYPLIAPCLETMFPANSGAVYVFDDKRTSLHAVVRWGTTPPAAGRIAAESCLALRNGSSHYRADHGDACDHLPMPRPAVSLCVPLIAKAEPLGFLHLNRGTETNNPDASGSPAEYSEYKQKLAQAAAEQIAAAIANARLHQDLLSQAIRDPLTGLFNRRSLEESLAHELHRAHRRKTRVGVLMIDIDQFKRVNDEHGHAAGDLALREIAGFLLGMTRREDIVCRYGGEEIVVLLLQVTMVDLQRRAEEIREGIKQLALEFDGRPLGPVTVSIGASLAPDHGDDPDVLLRAADEALYRAKAAGRDRVELAGAKRSVAGTS